LNGLSFKGTEEALVQGLDLVKCNENLSRLPIFFLFFIVVLSVNSVISTEAKKIQNENLGLSLIHSFFII